MERSAGTLPLEAEASTTNERVTTVRLALGLIVAVYLALGLSFALSTPLWQAPDEPAHFNYVRDLAEGKGLPVLQMGDYDQTYLEVLRNRKFPPELAIDGVRYESHQPPLYYLLAAGVYRAASTFSPAGLSLDYQVFSVRLFSVALGALLILVAFAIARQLFPAEPLLGLGTALFVAAVPQHLAIAAAVSNDLLAELVFSLILLLLLRPPEPAARRIPRSALTLGVLLGLALLTKMTIYAAVFLIPLGLWLRAPAGRRRHYVIDRLAVINGMAILIAGWWFVRNVGIYGLMDPFGLHRHDLVVEGQERTVLGLQAAVNFLGVGFRSFWAQLGWMSVPASDETYLFLGVISALIVVGLLCFTASLLAGRKVLALDQGRGLVLLLAAIGLVLLAWAQYNLRYIQPQGRYLFPAIVPLALLLALGLRELVQRSYLRPVLVLLVGAMGVFILTQARELAPPSREPLLFALLSSAGAGLAVVTLRRSLWLKPAAEAGPFVFSLFYVALVALDVVALVHMLPFLVR